MNIEELNTALAQIFVSDDLLINEPMSKHTTFRCGGPARFFVRASNAADITAAINAAEKADTPWWIVGCGSDLLVSDAGLPGVVIEIGERMAHISIDESVVRVQAGATNEAVAQAALEAGLTGYEFASGIPGSVGGAAIMNAGAYDGEFKDVAASVSCLFPDGTVREIPAEKADWSYRHSMMSDEGLVVLGATLQLAAGNKDDIRAKMDDLAQRRSSKQPLEMASAGSTFKRPVGGYAAALIDAAGLKGYAVGGAQVSEKHAGFVVNRGGATFDDVLRLMDHIRSEVLRTSGVELEPEVKIIRG